jgi:putative transposase
MPRSRARTAHPTIPRTDLLPSNLTASKEAKIMALLAAYRRGAVLLGREQWRLFQETGRFTKNHDLDKITFASVVGAANRVQMCRYQVVGQLQGWISNRANEFRDTVQRSTLDPDTKHMLHVINRLGAWFRRDDVVMRDTGEVVPDQIRKLARSIMRHVMSRHRRPDLSRISMRLDHRAACLAAPTKATQGGRVEWWVNLSTMASGQKIAVPLLGYEHHRARLRRGGRLTNGVQVNRRDGRLSFGVMTDEGAACAASRASYRPATDCIALDFGLSTLFATSEGQLLGQGWLPRLRAYDRTITDLARGTQRRGMKPRDNSRYRAAVAALRGFLRTEVGRVVNRLVAEGRPAALAVERLDFRNPDLSRRMNAILRNCGRSVIEAKLRNVADRFGVEATEVNPAYTSQTCSVCGYVDKKNRRTQSRFACLWCGHQQHADLNAARNINGRRAIPIGSVRQGKAAVLAELVRGFGERRVRAYGRCRTGSRGAPADPRQANPYFGGVRPIAPRKPRRLAAQDVVLATAN